MFNNVGGKIKTLAKVLCWIGIIFSILAGIGLMAGRSSFDYGSYRTVSVSGSVIGGIITMLIGSLMSWLGSLSLYGMGELIENTTIIAKNTTNNNSNVSYDNQRNFNNPDNQNNI